MCIGGEARWGSSWVKDKTTRQMFRQVGEAEVKFGGWAKDKGEVMGKGQR